ncbi:MAG: Ig-like domain-containing protein [Clostridiaceae bacterium]
MKRTIALLLGLIFLLMCVPVTALADEDVNARLEVTLNPTAKTLFQYGSDMVFNWQNADLTVLLRDKTPENTDGTVLTLANEISAGKYVIMIGSTVYNPAAGLQYAFTMADLGPKTITIKYTYKPSGQTKEITVTKDLSISIQNNVLQSIAITGPSQLSYYAGEYINLSGLVVKATYSNMTDPVTLDSSKYTVSLSKVTGGITSDVITPASPLTVQNTLTISVSETYPGSETVVTKTATASPTVAASLTSLSILPTAIPMTLGLTAPQTISATTAPATTYSSLVASVDNPAIAAIDTSTLTADGKVKVTALSVGTAIVTIRARGTSFTYTTTVTVIKAPTYVTSVILDKSTLTLPVNGTYALAATAGPEDSTDKTVTWKVDAAHESDVTVDATGTVKVLRYFSDEATITASANGDDPALAAPGVIATCKVKVNTITVDGVSISDTNITLYNRSSKTLTAVVSPYNAADPSVTWTSSNTAVATVDAVGKVTAVGIPAGAAYGEATITAHTSNSSIFANCTVKVLPSILSTGITLNTSTLSMNVGDEQTLTASVQPSNATNKTLNWTSDNTDVATVNSSGRIIAAAKGTAIIKATAADGSGLFASCTVTVSNIQILNISLDKTSLDLSEGDTATVKATIYPTNATTSALKWTSSNTSVATVDSKGNIIAGATQGYTIIKASATDGSGRSAECVVLSKPKIHVTGITINYGASLDLLINDSTYLKATILPANASSTTVVWSTSNASIASIDAATGLVKGVALGEATITATVDGKTVTIKVNVTNTEYNYGVAANFKRRVNVRSTASGLGKLVGYAYVGDTFHILGKTGSWYYIQYNNKTKGYIWSSYLKASKTSSGYTSAGSGTSTGTTGGTTTPTGNPTKVTIANCVYAVNVRSAASTTSKRIGKASLGATYTYLGKEGDWYKIQYNTTTVGYVYSTFGSLS